LNVPFHDHFKRQRAEVRIVGNLVDERHQAGELIAPAVGKQRWHACRFHFCILIVQFDEPHVQMFLGECS
jgi:hypothetical protein